MSARLRDLRVASKLFLAFGVLCALLVTVVLLAVSRLGASQEALSSMYSSSLQSVSAAGEVDAAFQTLDGDLTDIALAPDDASSDRAVADLQTDAGALADELAAYQQSGPAATPQERDALAALLAQYTTARDATLDLAQAEDVAPFMAARDSTVVPLAAEVDAAISTLKDDESAAAARAQEAGAAAYRSAVLTMVALAVLALAVAATTAVVVARSIVRPLSRAVAVISGLAQGHLDGRVGYVSKDEVGQLSVAADASLEQFSGVVRRIAESATVLASSSEELTAASSQMAAGAEESSVQAQVVSSATEEISANIGVVAAAGAEMTSAIDQIARSTSTASETASAAVTAAGAAGATIQRLGTSSREIGDVVKLITSIAEQTNLLALNATIEAARAGEAGKGFAVVANEVKELAQQTARATEQITARVGATQTDTSAAAAAIVQIGEVIGRIDDLQSTIAAAVEEQSATTNEMVRNIGEISTGSNEISANISGIAAASAQTTTSAARSSTTAGEVSRTAAELKELVSGFRY